MKRTPILMIALFLVLVVSGMKCAPKSESEPDKTGYRFRKDGELKILSPSGEEKAGFDIEIVIGEEELKRGLKFRESMEESQGMLFIFDGNQSHGFWMQDTYIPLDMLFIDSDGNIFQIVENTVPFSEDNISAEGLNKYTLEINAGLTKKYNIRKGDRIAWKRID